VAIKISSAQFSDRFEREAHSIAALNHPHICALYDVGPDYLVMELVEGPALAARIGDGALPLDEALAIAAQIAEALEAAHEKGIVHRDLKPGNIKLTADGKVKVLDFGLAKALDNDGAAPADPRNSPTLTLSPTGAGVILGTAGYMSPEQARGVVVDKRADIWAFGVVLYEMLTGRSTFAGETISDTLAAVLKTDPDWSALPPETPAAIRRVLRRCLERDRRRRLRDIGDALVEIEEARTEASVVPQTGSASARWPWAVAGVLVVALAATTVLLYRVTRPVLHPLLRVSVDLGPDALLARGTIGEGMDLSPDGMRLVFTSQNADGKVRLAVRRLNESIATPLAGTENAFSPFFSPDGQWIGFFADQRLKKISAEGGAPITLCEGSGPGESWGDDGNIIAALSPAGGLARIPASGGAPTPLTQLDPKKGEKTHRWPQVLPGSQAVLFTAHDTRGNYEEANIDVVSLTTGQRKTLHRGGFYGRYLPSGHLVYVHHNTLYAAPFDLGHLSVEGTPRILLDDVRNSSASGGFFAFSRAGTLAYLSGRAVGSGMSIFWMDSSGKTQPLHPAPRLYAQPKLSPDGKLLALSVDNGAGQDIAVLDIDRDTISRLSFLSGSNSTPVWSPDGKYLVFLSTAPASPGIYWVRADGSGEPQRLTEGKSRESPQSFTPDGRQLVFVQESKDTGFDIWTAPVEGDRDHPHLGKAEPFLRTPFTEFDTALSPDGRWMAYTSNESGSFEIYIRPFPGPGGKWQISTGGGMYPIWSRNGRELFFRAPITGLLVVAEYATKGDTFVPGKLRVWSERNVMILYSAPMYDLAPDGKRFVVFLPAGDAGEQKPVTQATFLLNFFDELRRRVPTGNR
jgi:Tol biopolymer transport system component